MEKSFIKQIFVIFAFLVTTGAYAMDESRQSEVQQKRRAERQVRFNRNLIQPSTLEQTLQPVLGSDRLAIRTIREYYGRPAFIPSGMTIEVDDAEPTEPIEKCTTQVSATRQLAKIMAGAQNKFTKRIEQAKNLGMPQSTMKQLELESTLWASTGKFFQLVNEYGHKSDRNTHFLRAKMAAQVLKGKSDHYALMSQAFDELADINKVTTAYNTFNAAGHAVGNPSDPAAQGSFALGGFFKKYADHRASNTE